MFQFDTERMALEFDLIIHVCTRDIVFRSGVSGVRLSALYSTMFVQGTSHRTTGPISSGFFFNERGKIEVVQRQCNF